MGVASTWRAALTAIARGRYRETFIIYAACYQPARVPEAQRDAIKVSGRCLKFMSPDKSIASRRTRNVRPFT